MQLPLDGALIYSVINIVPWTKQGTAYVIGGSFPIVSGTPSRTLMPSTNTTQGYGNGQMLATASGVTSGSTPSGLTAGGLYNVDASSTDTGQQVWNGMIICDPSLHLFLPINTTYDGTIQVATPSQGWVIRQQFLYTAGTASTDATLVANQLASYVSNHNGPLAQGQVMNPSGSAETIFAY